MAFPGCNTWKGPEASVCPKSGRAPCPGRADEELASDRLVSAVKPGVSAIKVNDYAHTRV